MFLIDLANLACRVYTYILSVKKQYYTVGFDKSLRGPSVRIKTTLITVHVGGTRACPPTCKMGTFFHISLALSMPISNKFQLNPIS